jgi:predicted nucleotidyltransferase
LVVVLVGRYARGDASPDSDLDIIVVGPEASSWRSERRDGFLVSVSAPPFEKRREAFRDLGSICSAVLGWREALIVHDIDGLAASLIEETRTWRPLERRCDEWVAEEEATGYAEEVHKLVAALRGTATGRRQPSSGLCSPYIWHPC